ncbi:hypothetical protein GGS24DRAFT_499643 [Hypoxylon argillaceum]|nr:hypothetical protein GGS24DRAFT_499643 [Hypoxylon argillaceum]
MADQKLRSQLSDFFKPVLSVGADLTSRYIDLIPGGCGLGMLKGGLALVFEEDNAKKILLDVFGKIPKTILTINTAYALLDPEEDDKQIRQDFYDTLFKDVLVLIAILLGSEAFMSLYSTTKILVFDCYEY